MQQDEDQQEDLQQPLSLQDELELSDGGINGIPTSLPVSCLFTSGLAHDQDGGINGIPTSSLMLPHDHRHHKQQQPETSSNYRQIFAKLFTLIRTNTEEEVT